VDPTTARLLLGAGSGAAELVWRAGAPVRAASAGLLRGGVAVLDRVSPGTVAALVRRGRRERVLLARWVDRLLREVVALVVDALLRTVDLTALVREHVALDEVAAGLDVDAVAARVDVDAIVARVDLDAAVRRVDLDAIVRRLDLDRAVVRVDVEAVVRRVDLDSVAAGLDVDRVAARLDLDAVVRRLDLVGIAREVVDALDLPGIIRSSTGALTSDTVRTVRSEAMNADGVVAGAMDRLLRRGAPPPAPRPPVLP
jgi:hypothetical protein